MLFPPYLRAPARSSYPTTQRAQHQSKPSKSPETTATPVGVPLNHFFFFHCFASRLAAVFLRGSTQAARTTSRAPRFTTRRPAGHGTSPDRARVACFCEGHRSVWLTLFIYFLLSAARAQGRGEGWHSPRNLFFPLPPARPFNARASSSLNNNERPEVCAWSQRGGRRELKTRFGPHRRAVSDVSHREGRKSQNSRSRLLFAPPFPPVGARARAGFWGARAWGCELLPVGRARPDRWT